MLCYNLTTEPDNTVTYNFLLVLQCRNICIQLNSFFITLCQYIGEHELGLDSFCYEFCKYPFIGELCRVLYPLLTLIYYILLVILTAP